METETDIRARELGAPFNCQICGEIEHLQWLRDVQERLGHHKLCHSCDFWVERAYKQMCEPERYLVCRGEAYSYIPDDETFFGSRGYGGAQWTIVFRDGRRVETKNLWHQGVVPAHFRHLLPDNAELNRGKVGAL